MNTPEKMTTAILHRLGFPVHRIGYKLLCTAIPRYAAEDLLCCTKSLYPQLAEQFGYGDWRSVEGAIRRTIQNAWEHRDPAVWEEYFPRQEKSPSNLVFIATLAEYLS